MTLNVQTYSIANSQAQHNRTESERERKQYGARSPGAPEVVRRPLARRSRGCGAREPF
jgi:hypothetical protein